MTERESLKDRVNRGAEWLDAVRPEWWTEINVGTLDLSSSCHCVLGQVVGSAPPDKWGHVSSGFYVTLDATSDRFVYDHGFVAGLDENYADLDELWIAQIKARWSGEQVA